jgi:hypothetical protein
VRQTASMPFSTAQMGTWNLVPAIEENVISHTFFTHSRGVEELAGVYASSEQRSLLDEE